MNRKLALVREWMELLGEDPKELEKHYNNVWRNIMHDGGYRLHVHGYNVMQELQLKSWTIKIKNTELTSGITLLRLDKILDQPYWIDNKRKTITLWSEDLATQLLLYDGDLTAYLEAQNNF